MQIHASCVARSGRGVLLLGPPGAGKSDLALRLIDRGFVLVADDRVEIDGLVATAPVGLAGLIEVRGLGILRLPSIARAVLALAVQLREEMPRMPDPARLATPDLPLIVLDPRGASAALRVALALDCLEGAAGMVSGAFSP
ncbi:MAG: HPr kinase/phosphatase C-terminal domain-containing protein [Alphaproteobacteria bacterium]|nr:HPr kinase/phosphatase C-terminal domain-containing protein [Alphaproteobacteria bacterium]